MKKVLHRIIDGIECKQCNHCLQWLPLDKFFKNKQMSDGYQGKCKECASATIYAKYNATNKAKAAGKRYRESERGRAWRTAYVNSTKGAFAVLRASQRYRHSIKGMQKYKERDQLYRDNKKLGDFTHAQWQVALEYFDHKCAYCGVNEANSQDHFFPMKLGGTYTVDNILPACKSCNSSKQALEPDIWLDQYVSEIRANKIIKYFEEVVLK